jgi:hypothetical protein
MKASASVSDISHITAVTPCALARQLAPRASLDQPSDPYWRRLLDEAELLPFGPAARL